MKIQTPLTVNQLIEKLKRCPQDSLCVVFSANGTGYYIEEVYYRNDILNPDQSSIALHFPLTELRTMEPRV